MLKGELAACNEAVSWHIPGGTEGNHENSRRLASRRDSNLAFPKCETGFLTTQLRRAADIIIDEVGALELLVHTVV
jgi:hypothetical protein